MSWRWTARKWAVTAFVTWHLSALAVWNLPGGVIRERLQEPLACYLLPTGLWQSWGMFAPNPNTASLTLGALTRDRHGVLRSYSYPSVGDTPPWRAIGLYRHAKYANVLGQPECSGHREFAARTVLRRLAIPPEDYPVDVQLHYEVRRIPAPVETTDLPPLEPIRVIETYQFPTRAEVDP